MWRTRTRSCSIQEEREREAFLPRGRAVEREGRGENPNMEPVGERRAFGEREERKKQVEEGREGGLGG